MDNENNDQGDKRENTVTEISSRVKVGVKALPTQVEMTHIAWKKDWYKLILVAILTVTTSYLTSSWIIGLWGFVIGTVSAVIIFFLGLFAITKSITKKIIS